MVHAASLFSQVLQIISRPEFQRHARGLRSDRYSKGFSSGSGNNPHPLDRCPELRPLSIPHHNLHMIQPGIPLDPRIHVVDIEGQFILSLPQALEGQGIGDPGPVIHDELRPGSTSLLRQQLVIQIDFEFIRLRVVVDLHPQGNPR